MPIISSRRRWAVLLLALPFVAFASPVTIPNVFTNGTVADADQVNANFTALEVGVDDNDSRIQTLEAEQYWTSNGTDVYYDAGWVGVGTSAPVAPVHITEGDGPSVLLEQDGSAGLTPQSWAVYGSESGFALVDVTNGNQTPFAVEPGAAAGSLFVDSAGQVGVGTASPTERLHVTGTDGSTQVLIREDGPTTADRPLLVLENNGGPSIFLSDTSSGRVWGVEHRQGTGNFTVSFAGTGIPEFEIDQDGGLSLAGILVHASDRRLKEELERIDAPLERLDALHGYTYTRKRTGKREVGLVAQEVAVAMPEAVKTREDGMLTVAYSNLVGLLVEVNRAQQEAIEALEDRTERAESESAALRGRLDRLERRLDAAGL